jgi:MFS family permease
MATTSPDKNIPPSSNGEPSGLRLIGRALRHRNYRLFFIGQAISLIGTWMQQIAMSWLVYRLTSSAFLLGLVNFAANIPIFLVSPFAGILADRWNRHRMLIIVQALAMIQAFILAALVLADVITVWEIVVLGIFLGVVNAFDMPIRQAYVVEMIEHREDLGNAIALNSSIFNLARLVGPSIAGIMIAAVGEGYCFLLNGISYIAVIIALFAMKPVVQKAAPAVAPVWQGLKEGLSYSFGFQPIRSVLLLLSLVSIIGMPYTVLMPVVAKTVLHGGSHTLGMLVGASGVGALVGAIYLASRKDVRGLGRIIPTAAAIFGVGLVTLSLSRQVWLSMFFMVVTGFGMIVQMASCNTVLQTIVDEDKRGRVMSLYAMSIRGVAPFGSLIAGSLAAVIGTPNTLLIGGLCCVAGALVFARNLPAWRNHIRPIYIRKGIVPEVSSGIQSATEMTRPGPD